MSPLCSKIRAWNITQIRQYSYGFLQTLTTLWQEKKENYLDTGWDCSKPHHPAPSAMQMEKPCTNTVCNDLAQSDHNDTSKQSEEVKGCWVMGCGLHTSKQPSFLADGWEIILGCIGVQCRRPNQPRCQPKTDLQSGDIDDRVY